MGDPSSKAVDVIRAAVGELAVLATCERENALAALLVGETEAWVAVAELESGKWTVPGAIAGKQYEWMFAKETASSDLVSLIWWTPVGWSPGDEVPTESWHCLAASLSSEVLRLGVESAVDSVWVPAPTGQLCLALLCARWSEVPAISVETQEGRILQIPLS